MSVTRPRGLPRLRFALLLPAEPGLSETREEEKKSIFGLVSFALSLTRIYSRYTHHVKAEPFRAHAIGLTTIFAPSDRIRYDRGGQGQGGPAHGTLGRG